VSREIDFLLKILVWTQTLTCLATVTWTQIQHAQVWIIVKRRKLSSVNWFRESLEQTQSF